MTADLTPKSQLIALSKALRNLHKQLIDVETRYFGQVGNPLEHLQLVVNHPHFSWIQKLSSLIAQIDERLDDAPEVVMMHGAVRQLLVNIRPE